MRIFNASPKGDGVVAVALVESPAHESTFEAFEADKYQFADAKKQVITGALMIPDKLIFRKDGEGNPYYLKFSAEAIELAALLFHKNKFTDVTNEEHTDTQLSGVYMFESVLVTSKKLQGHFKDMGLGDLPVGTWVGSYKVDNTETFQKIESGELRGFSVEMFLNLEEADNFYKINTETVIVEEVDSEANGYTRTTKINEKEVAEWGDGSKETTEYESTTRVKSTYETAGQFEAAQMDIDLMQSDISN